MLKNAAAPDSTLLNEDNALHLFFVRQMLSWDLMESCGVFSDAERLQIANYLLRVARSAQGVGYAGLRAGLYSRQNHGTRAAPRLLLRLAAFRQVLRGRPGDRTPAVAPEARGVLGRVLRQFPDL